MIAPGQAVPEPWTTAPVVRVDAETLNAPDTALGALRVARQTAARTVIELDVGFDDDPRSSTGAPPFELGPRFAFDLDELHHLVWSNSIDARNPERWVWLTLDRAIAAGARELSATSGPSVGDVTLADGTAVWLDGGPVRFVGPIDGVPVIHDVALEHGGRRVPAENTSAADLAPDQLAAVTHPGGAARIIAPAGSGKTRVLTERRSAPPDAVEHAGVRSEPRGVQQAGPGGDAANAPAICRGLQVRTLNAIALAIVNGSAPFAPQARNWRTIDEPEVRRIIGDLVSFPRQRNADPVAPWIEALSLVRLGLVSPERAEQQYDGDVDGLRRCVAGLPGALERQRRSRLRRPDLPGTDRAAHRSPRRGARPSVRVD